MILTESLFHFVIQRIHMKSAQLSGIETVGIIVEELYNTSILAIVKDKINCCNQVASFNFSFFCALLWMKVYVLYFTILVMVIFFYFFRYLMKLLQLPFRFTIYRATAMCLPTPVSFSNGINEIIGREQEVVNISNILNGSKYATGTYFAM